MTSSDDRLDVIETCNRFGWHADQRQWDESRSLLADVVEVDYTRLSGGEPDSIARADLVASWAERFARLTTTQHMITNHRVTLQGDSAVCSAGLRALHIAPTPDGDQEVVIYGHYRFGLARTPEGWRIDSIVMTPTWTTGDLTLLEPTPRKESAERLPRSLGVKPLRKIEGGFDGGPGRGLVVEGPGLQASVQDADEPVVVDEPGGPAPTAASAACSPTWSP